MACEISMGARNQDVELCNRLDCFSAATTPEIDALPRACHVPQVTN
jgi:hypothetical protein